MDPVEVLLRAPVFRDLRRSDVEELRPHLHRREFARGESVWVEGARADALYVVVSGQLKSYRLSSDGRELILLLTSGGDLAGEVGLFHPSRLRQVNVSAMEPTVCLTVARTPLVAFLARHPVAMERMLERLSDIGVRAAYSFSGVVFEDIRRRVARALLTLADEFGVPTSSGVRIRLRLSQAALAALVAASRENVNRALSGFVTEGAVSQVNGYFVIHDRRPLDAAVNGRR